MEDRLLHIISDYVARYLIQLMIEGEPFEYYWLNMSHPECVIDNMSDDEIARQYPLSGERLVLDCWGVVTEQTQISDTSWEWFVKFVNNYVLSCIDKINEGSSS